jgi:hypothetical protein
MFVFMEAEQRLLRALRQHRENGGEGGVLVQPEDVAAILVALDEAISGEAGDDQPVTLRVKGGQFTSDIVVVSRFVVKAGSPIEHMEGWPLSKVKAYCKRKKWKVRPIRTKGAAQDPEDKGGEKKPDLAAVS